MEQESNFKLLRIFSILGAVMMHLGVYLFEAAICRVFFSMVNVYQYVDEYFLPLIMILGTFAITIICVCSDCIRSFIMSDVQKKQI